MVKTRFLSVNVDMTVTCSVWCQGGAGLVQLSCASSLMAVVLGQGGVMLSQGDAYAAAERKETKDCKALQHCCQETV